MEGLTPERPQVAQHPFNRLGLVVGGFVAGIVIEMGLTALATGVVGGGDVSRAQMYGIAAIMAIGPGALFLLRRTSRAHPVLAPLTGGMLAGTLAWFLLSVLSGFWTR